jgi:hypothetical protein
VRAQAAKKRLEAMSVFDSSSAASVAGLGPSAAPSGAADANGGGGGGGGSGGGGDSSETPQPVTAVLPPDADLDMMFQETEIRNKIAFYSYNLAGGGTWEVERGSVVNLTTGLLHSAITQVLPPGMQRVPMDYTHCMERLRNPSVLEKLLLRPSVPGDNHTISSFAWLCASVCNFLYELKNIAKILNEKARTSQATSMQYFNCDGGEELQQAVQQTTEMIGDLELDIGLISYQWSSVGSTGFTSMRRGILKMTRAQVAWQTGARMKLARIDKDIIEADFNSFTSGYSDNNFASDGGAYHDDFNFQLKPIGRHNGR